MLCRSFPKSTCFYLVAAVFFSGAVVDPASANPGPPGPPIPFGAFTVGDIGTPATSGALPGEIRAACPSLGPETVTCFAPTVTDNGMFQREILIEGHTDPSLNGVYIQFILADPGTEGNGSADPFTAARGNLTFTNEDFVKQHNRAQGLSTKQVIWESSCAIGVGCQTGEKEERFLSVQEFNYGWGVDIYNPEIHAYQEISVIDYAVPATPEQTFGTTADIVSLGGQQNVSVGLSQMVNLEEFDPWNVSKGAGMQKFQHKRIDGIYQPTGTLGPPYTGTTLPGGTGPVTGYELCPAQDKVCWKLFEKVAALWVGQYIEGAGQFGHERYNNLQAQHPDETKVTRILGAADPDAQAWVAATFGAVDTMASLPTIQATAAVAAASALLPTVAAGTGSSDTTVVEIPAYDDWQVNNGVFANVACPIVNSVQAVCLPAYVNGQGVYQRLISINGEYYVQTIVTNANATGDPKAADFAANSLNFKTEAFVKFKSVMGGIASSLHIADRGTTPYLNQGTLTTPDPTDSGDFTYNTAVKTGWAHGGPLDPTFEVNQSVKVLDYVQLETSSIYESFSMKRGETDADMAMDMLSVAGSQAANQGFNDPIYFQTAMRSGAFQNTTHTAATDPDLLPSINGDIDWSPGDALQVTWLGGQYQTFSPGPKQVIGATSYTNLSTGARTANTSSTGKDPAPNPDPESWLNPPFGPTPVFINPFIAP